MTSMLGTDRSSRPPTVHFTRSDGPKISTSSHAPTTSGNAPQPSSTSLAATIATSNDTILATIKQEQTDFLRLAHHFDAFVVDAAVSPRVAATLGQIRQTIASHASELKAKPAATPRATAESTTRDRYAAPLSRPSTWASIASRPASASATSSPPRLQHPLPPRPAVAVPPPQQQDRSKARHRPEGDGSAS